MIKRVQLLVIDYRVSLWILLILLTAIILVFPVHLNYEYHAVESAYIFDNLPLFGTLYFIWIALLLLLLFTRGGEKKSHWEGLTLAAIFALVFLGFWAIIVPIRGGDALGSATTVNYISSQGTLSRHPNIGYLDFPGLFLLTSSICQITGLEVFDAVAVVLVFNALLLSALLYLLFSKSLRNPYFAIFAVLLLIQGTWTLSRVSFFTPWYLGLVFLTAFLVLLNRKEYALLDTWQDRLLAIILLAAVTMTHFVTSVCFLFVLWGIFLAQKASRPRFASTGIAQYKRRGVVDWSTVIIYSTIPLAWGVYYASTTFGGSVQLLLKFVSQGQLFGWASTMASVNLGEAIPLWANATRWFWLIFIFGLGLILWLRNLFRLRRLSLVEAKETGGLAGIILMVIVATLVSPGGEQGIRFLMYTPLFFVPIILRFFLFKPSQESPQNFFDEPSKGMGISKNPLKGGKSLGGWFNSHTRRYAFALVPILFLALSFPTFLAHNDKICSEYAFYSYDFSAGEFVLKTYGDSENLVVFSGGGTTASATFYFVVNASYPGMKALQQVRDSNEVWQELDKQVTRFENSGNGQSIFIFSERTKTPYQHVFGIEPSDPKWAELEQRLQKGSKIYDNGHIQIYTPIEKGHK